MNEKHFLDPSSSHFLSTNAWLHFAYLFLPSSLSLYRSGSAVPLWWTPTSMGATSGASSWVAPLSSSFCSFFSYKLRVDAERTSRWETLNCLSVLAIDLEHLKEMRRWQPQRSVHSTQQQQHGLLLKLALVKICNKSSFILLLHC